MDWLLCALYAHATLFFLIALLISCRHWVILALLLLFLALLYELLLHSMQVAMATARMLLDATPGDWSSLIRLADLAYDSGYYRVLEHGHWPTQPVLFLSTYPNEILEYWYFGWVAKQMSSQLSVMARSMDGLGPLRKSLMGCHFKEDDNYIAVSHDPGQFDTVVEQVAKHYKRGRSIFAYPESNTHLAKPLYTMQPLRTGLFRIAARLKIPIVALAWSHLCNKNRAIHLILSPPYSGNYQELLCQATLFFDTATTNLAYLASI